MNYWHRLTQRYKRRQVEGQLVLSRAYRAVFNGNPDRSQQQLVLADFAAQTGFFAISPPGLSSTELAYNEGKRAAFAIVFGHLTLSPDDMAALQNAARHEVVDIHSQDNN